MKTSKQETLWISDLKMEAMNDTQMLSAEDYEVIEQKSIYCLMDEESILDYEIQQQRWLNDGSPDLTDLNVLEDYAKENLSRSLATIPRERREKFVTGYIQTLVDVHFSNDGTCEEKWKTVVNTKLLLSEVTEDGIKDVMYRNSLPYSKYTRIVLYSPYLYDLVGCNKTSSDKKDYVAISDELPNILMAVPTLDEVDKYIADESLYAFAQRRLSENANMGLLPYEILDSGTYRHWEMTKYFYEEVQPTLSYNLRRPVKVNKYQEEMDLIESINKGVSIEFLESLSFETLSRVMVVARSKFNQVRIEDKALYSLVVSVMNSKSRNEEPTVDCKLVDKINRAEVEIETLTDDEIEVILKSVWNRSSSATIDDKDTYFKLKSLYYKNKRLRDLKVAA